MRLSVLPKSWSNLDSCALAAEASLPFAVPLVPLLALSRNWGEYAEPAVSTSARAFRSCASARATSGLFSLALSTDCCSVADRRAPVRGSSDSALRRHGLVVSVAATDDVPRSSGIARKLTLSFKVNPSVPVRVSAQGDSHEKTNAKANAVATTFRLGEFMPEFKKFVASIKKHVNRSGNGVKWRLQREFVEQPAK